MELRAVRQSSTRSTGSSKIEVQEVSEALDSAAAEEKLIEGQTFQSLKDNADKPLVGLIKGENQDGCYICGEQENHVGLVDRLEGHHPSATVGFLTSIVLEPGWITRVGAA